LAGGSQVDMASGSVSGVIICLAVPMMLSMFFQNLYSFINTIFVSWLGGVPLAAISMAVPLTYVAFSLAKGVGMGSAVIIGYARGAGDQAGAEAVSRAVLPLMTMVMCLLLPLLSVEVCNRFFSLLGASGEILEQVYWFTVWMVLGFPVLGYSMAVEALLMSNGDTVTPMKGMILGNIINICLDPLFIFGLKWGVAGAGGATFIAQFAAALYLGRKYCKLTGTALSFIPDKTMLSAWGQILKQGLFITVGFLVSPIGIMVLNGILAKFGPNAIGAWNMMSRMEMMVLLPVAGMGNALAVFAGFNMGRQDYNRIRAGLKTFLILACCIIMPAALLFFFFSHELLYIYKPVPELLVLASVAVHAAGVSMVFAPLLIALNSMAQGLKRPVYMLTMIILYIVVLRLPLAYWLAGLWGGQGVFWSHPASTFIAGLVAIGLLIKLLAKGEKKCETDKTAVCQ